MSRAGTRRRDLRALRKHLGVGKRTAFVIVAIAVTLNAVILNAILGASSHRVSSGDLAEASRANTYLGLTAQFNTVFLVIAISICVLLLATSLDSIYSARRRQFTVVRLCGGSLRQLTALQVGEVAQMTAGATVVAAIAFVPIAWGYERLLRLAALAPEQVGLGYNFGAVAIVAVVCLAFMSAVAAAKTRGAYRFDEDAGRAKRSRWPRIVVAVLLAATGVILFAPGLTGMTPDTQMVLILPWAAAVILAFGVDAIRWLAELASLGIRRTGTHPHLGVALARLSRSMGSRVNPVLPMTLVLVFVVPLSAVMATGRNASMAELYESVHAHALADASADLSFLQLTDLNRGDPQSLAIATSPSLYDAADPYGTTQPLVAFTDPGRIGEFFPAAKVEAGDIAAVAGNAVAAPASRHAVGDTVNLVTPAGGRCTLTVTATVDLPSIINYDYVAAGALDGCPGVNLTRTLVYSHENPDHLAAGLGSGWDVYAMDQWVAKGAQETVENQRTALLMIFFVPMLMAAFVTAVALGTRREMTAKSNAVLVKVGATVRNFRAVAWLEAATACGASAVLLALAFGINAAVIVPVARAAGVGVSLDWLLDGLFVLGTYVAICAIYLFTGRRRDVAVT